MISVREAERIIEKSLKAYPAETRVIQDCLNAILCEDVYADRDAPAFDKATMDGIAINIDGVDPSTQRFKIQGIQQAGHKQLKLSNKKNCFEISTGAIIPKASNTVIPIEKVEVKNGYAYLKLAASPKRWQYIQRKGHDHIKGTKLLSKGMKLNAPRIGIAAQAGKRYLRVSPKISLAIISTGDELVAINKKPKLFQIRISNSYALDAVFRSTQIFSTQLFHIKDDKKALLKELRAILNDFDVIVLSGGVSMGKFDYVPQTLIKLGVKVKFHKLAQKPGKPFWFGMSKRGQPVFALPGNPVSTLVCAYRYALPQLLKALGFAFKTDIVKLSFSPVNKSKMTLFLPVSVRTDNDVLTAYKMSYQGSGDFGALSQSDGFEEIPSQGLQQKMYKYYSWDIR